MKRMTLMALALMVAVTFAVGESVKTKRQTVYMFGFAVGMADSVVVITDVQKVEAFALPNGFLADRSLYSLQLNNYLLGMREMNNMTCAIYYEKTRAKAEKRYEKMTKRYRDDHAGVLTFLGEDEFQFQAEVWEEPTSEDVKK